MGLLQAAAAVVRHVYTHLADSHTDRFQAGIASDYRHQVDQAVVEVVHSHLVDRTTDAVAIGARVR
jgi:hypothetical protein